MLNTGPAMPASAAFAHADSIKSSFDDRGQIAAPSRRPEAITKSAFAGKRP